MQAESTSIKRERFLELLGKGISVSGAARGAALDRNGLYGYRERHPEFAAAWDEAQREGTHYLIDEARRRAVEGCAKPMVHQGKIITRSVPDSSGIPGLEQLEEIWLREYSDTLLMFLLKSRDREQYDDAAARAKLERQWAKEDGKTDVRMVPAETVIDLLEAFEARKSAAADHGNSSSS